MFVWKVVCVRTTGSIGHIHISRKLWVLRDEWFSSDVFGLILTLPHVVIHLVMVALGKSKFSACSGPSGHGRLYLNGVGLYELVDLEVSHNSLEVVPV